MSELRREEILEDAEALERDTHGRFSRSIDGLKHMALRTLDAEAERDRMRQAHEDTQDRLSEARQEAARLREALQEIRPLLSLLVPALKSLEQPLSASNVELALDRVTEALQSAPPASEPAERNEDGTVKGGKIVRCACGCGIPLGPKEGRYVRGHADPAPADRPEHHIPLETRSGDDVDRQPIGDRPEPSGALELLDYIKRQLLYDEQLGLKGYEAEQAFTSIRQALSQPAPAVPDAVRRLPEELREGVKANPAYNSSSLGYNDGVLACANRIDEALATPPDDGDSPAVPDGYVLLPKEPTEGMLIQFITNILTVEGGSDAIELMRRNYYRAIAAAPTPTDGEKDGT